MRKLSIEWNKFKQNVKDFFSHGPRINPDHSDNIPDPAATSASPPYSYTRYTEQQVTSNPSKRLDDRLGALPNRARYS